MKPTNFKPMNYQSIWIITMSCFVPRSSNLSLTMINEKRRKIGRRSIVSKFKLKKINSLKISKGTLFSLRESAKTIQSSSK